VRIIRAFAAAAAGLTVAAAGVSVWPAAALADQPGAIWVSGAPTVGGSGTSCRHPGYNTIRAAIRAAPSRATIEVCKGTYAEQLQITRSVTIQGVGTVVVKLPATPANSNTACDKAPGTGSFQRDQDGVAICGKGTVSLIHLTIDAAWPSGTCDDSLYGILVGGGATLQFVDSTITAAGAQPINGCQGGVAIQAGMAWTTPVEVGHLVTDHSAISGYQKNGITVDGARSTAVITHTTVTGAGATPAIAQNGIQVSNGAKAQILDSKITGNECDVSVCGPNGLTQTQSTGLLLYGAARGTTVADSTIAGNDIGVYYSANPGRKAPARQQVSIVRDGLSGNRYEGVVLDQGSAYVGHCTFSSGNVGIQVLQYSGQTFGSRSFASYDRFSHMHVATVQVLSDDAATGDLPGSFMITRSEISTAPVLDNSTNLPIRRRFDH
jgi:hypothetical protein